MNVKRCKQVLYKMLNCMWTRKSKNNGNNDRKKTLINSKAFKF